MSTVIELKRRALLSRASRTPSSAAPPAPAVPADRTRSSSLTWLPIAAVLVGAGWGSNQFTPMLLVYHHALGLGTGTLEALFGAYALGLLPGLLLGGPLSDAHGRRAVVWPAAVISLAASAALVAGAHSLALLFAGRLLAGVGSGAVFGAGSGWLREAAPPSPAPGATARRAAVAMTAGFALGPLVAGLLAQWAPSPAIVPYLPHLALMAAVVVALRWTPATAPRRSARTGAPGLALAGLRHRRFVTVVLPMAPWVFAAPAIAFALLPSVVGANRAADGVGLTAAITALTALAGVLIQPLGRRLQARSLDGGHAAVAGLATLAAGLALAAATASVQQDWLLVPTAIVLGGAYGLTLVAGLHEVQRLADQATLAALTAAYYALTYVGFAAPFLLTLAAPAAGYPALLAATAALALATCALISRTATRRV